MPTQKNKIALVIQRYGLEVNGGAELHCRLLAERLRSVYDVDVLTSCAESYQTWENYYEAGESYINGVRVLRFLTQNKRNKSRKSFRFVRQRLVYQKVLKVFKLLSLFEKLFPALKPGRKDFEKWLADHGCAVPELIGFLKENHSRYKAVIFFTYLYYPTVLGLEVVPEKSILIPTAHDEPSIYIPFFKRVFNLPAAIVYNTSVEKNFVNSLFRNEYISSIVVGVGVDIKTGDQVDQIKKSLNSYGDYFLYLGRVEAGKGCGVLIDYFTRYVDAKGSHHQVNLVLAGQVLLPLKDHPNVVSLGYVSDQLKLQLLLNAKALIVPSFYESLSMVTLEAMKLGTPVIVNGKCEVLRDHIERSGAGLLYYAFDDFQSCLNTVLEDSELKQQFGVAGKRYVDNNYNWDIVIEKLTGVIEEVASEQL